MSACVWLYRTALGAKRRELRFFMGLGDPVKRWIRLDPKHGPLGDVNHLHGMACCSMTSFEQKFTEAQQPSCPQRYAGKAERRQFNLASKRSRIL